MRINWNWFNLPSKILVIAGAINWGLVGAFGYNLVESLLGAGNFIAVKFVYIAVGVAGVYKLIHWFIK